MVVDAALQAELQLALQAMERLPLLTVLEQQGVLARLIRQLLLERLREGVTPDPAETARIAGEICAALAQDPPTHPDRHWPQTLPEAVAPQAARLWQQRLHSLAVEARFGDRLEAYYLSRRSELDQVVFRLIRLEQLGLAEELYLRLLDDGASFGDLAEGHGRGEERHTRGLVGPLPLAQPHPRIRAALAPLEEGEIAPPFQVERTILLVRLEKRLPAQLTPTIREQLLGELLEQELEAAGMSVLEDLRRRIQASGMAAADRAEAAAPVLLSIGGLG